SLDTSASAKLRRSFSTAWLASSTGDMTVWASPCSRKMVEFPSTSESASSIGSLRGFPGQRRPATRGLDTRAGQLTESRATSTPILTLTAAATLSSSTTGSLRTTRNSKSNSLQPVINSRQKQIRRLSPTWSRTDLPRRTTCIKPSNRRFRYSRALALLRSPCRAGRLETQPLAARSDQASGPGGHGDQPSCGDDRPAVHRANCGHTGGGRKRLRDALPRSYHRFGHSIRLPDTVR